MGAEQLLQIETVPISFEYVEHKEPATLSKSIAKLEIKHDGKNHNLDIRPEKLRLRMDGFNRSSSKDASSFDRMSYTATAGLTDSGKLTLNVNLMNGETSGLRYSQVGRSPEALADTIGTSVNMDYFNYFPLGENNLSISFDLSGLSGLGEGTFTPPDLELEVKEMARVEITYVGGPIYFPKSADPNYKAEDSGVSLDIKA